MEVNLTGAHVHHFSGDNGEALNLLNNVNAYAIPRGPDYFTNQSYFLTPVTLIERAAGKSHCGFFQSIGHHPAKRF
jgi:hypothetical protein